MEFEFDADKSRSNQEKHGIDFERAQAIWEDVDRMEIPARHQDEPRFLVIGKSEKKHWSAIITYRGEKIRIISVRRSRLEEIQRYEND